jgi:nucleoside-diphosphate-sugar epimerase
MEPSPSSAASDLLIIGAGALGRRVGRLWRAHHRQASVLAETRSGQSHSTVREEGMIPRLRSAPDPPAMPHVLFSVPPSSQDDYAAEAARAASLWRGEGRLLITSSTAVYAEEDGGRCVEGSPLARSPRALRLRDAEDRLLTAGGIVVRLAGLYDHDRGPHRVYLRTRTSPRRPDGLISLIHYDDAANLCVQALSRGHAGAVYLGCDDHPITRHELVKAAARSKRYRATTDPPQACRFTGCEGPTGRRCDSAWTRRALGWEPTHRRFLDWVDDAEAP